MQVCYFFYKNIAFGLTLFYFEAYTSFSGQSVYDDWYMLLFNVILTSLPVISLGVFEQDVSSDVCLQVKCLNSLSFEVMSSGLLATISSQESFKLTLNSFLHFSSQLFTSKVLRTCFLIGIEYLAGWEMAYMRLSSYSSSTSTYFTTRHFVQGGRHLTCHLLEPPCSLVSSGQ